MNLNHSESLSWLTYKGKILGIVTDSVEASKYWIIWVQDNLKYIAML